MSRNENEHPDKILIKYMVEKKKTAYSYLAYKVYYVEDYFGDKATIFAVTKKHAAKIAHTVFGWVPVEIREAVDSDLYMYGHDFNVKKIINYDGEFDKLYFFTISESWRR